MKARPLAERWSPSEQDRNCLDFVISARVDKRSPDAEEISGNCGDSSLFPPELLNGLFGNIDDAYVHLQAKLDEYAAIPRFGPRFVYHRGLAAFRADTRFMPTLARLGYPQYWLQTGKWPDFCRKEKLPYDCRQAAAAAVADLK